VRLLVHVWLSPRVYVCVDTMQFQTAAFCAAEDEANLRREIGAPPRHDEL
jgi:hypothetical protein